MLSTERGKNVKDVAIELGYGENYFYSFNSGKKPSSEKLETIADYFNVSIDYLLGRTNQRTLLTDNTVQTIAAHHDEEEWTEEELEEIEQFKRFVAMRREARKHQGE
ncbi:helix-turn-helix domain-containing protein [Lysinibacillus xylanilyticus]|uniref:helix-turn-helix domain-containing protein n=1 Tax=Lysinibacillus xylanilyticus TaxID=582475 RepID=UPI0037F9CBA0